MKKKLKLMADYNSFPLWGEGEAIGNINPSHLPLSQELIAELLNWATAYDSTLNQDYPPDSGFVTEEESHSFEQQGMRLWRRLCDELSPSYQVSYFSQELNRLLTHPTKSEDTESIIT